MSAKTAGIGFLSLTRRVGEKILIDGGIEIVLVEAQNGRAAIGVKAPPDVRIEREEVRIQREQGLSRDEAYAIVRRDVDRFAAERERHDREKRDRRDRA